jgi:membrane protease subunit HflC
VKKLIIVLVVIFAALILFLLAGPFYVVNEGETAVVTRFGKIVSVKTEAGLKFKRNRARSKPRKTSSSG